MNATGLWFIINLFFKVFIDRRITLGIDCHWLKIFPMQEINPIKNKIADLKSRGDALRRYL